MPTVSQYAKKFAELRAPAQLEGYIRALGMEKAIEFLLEFGGTPMAIRPRPHENYDNMMTRVITREQITALAKELGEGLVRIPASKPFICLYFAHQGLSSSAIGRKLHITDQTVRSMLRREYERLEKHEAYQKRLAGGPKQALLTKSS